MNIAICAEGNMPCMVAENVDHIITSLEQLSNVLFEWFKKNLLKSNADRFHLIVTKNDTGNINVARCNTDECDTDNY